MKVNEKKIALEYRKQGMSIGDIATRLTVSKSTVSLWVRDTVLDNKARIKLSLKNSSNEVTEKRRSSRLRTENDKKENAYKLAGRHINSISKQELRFLALGIYWGEGGKVQKGSVRISNSDPEIILIIMKFFREHCLVEDGKFRALIHTHSKTQVESAEVYWSNLIKIPRKQFYKTYIQKNKVGVGKRKTLPYGTLDVYIPDVKLFYEIIGQIKKIAQILL